MEMVEKLVLIYAVISCYNVGLMANFIDSDNLPLRTNNNGNIDNNNSNNNNRQLKEQSSNKTPNNLLTKEDNGTATIEMTWLEFLAFHRELQMRRANNSLPSTNSSRAFPQDIRQPRLPQRRNSSLTRDWFSEFQKNYQKAYTNFTKKKVVNPKADERAYYFKKAGDIWKYGTPPVMAIGTVGNVLSIMVMLRKKFRSTTMSFYLTTLAIADTFVLYFCLLPRTLSVYEIEAIEFRSDLLCKLKTFLLYYVSHVDSWIIVCLTCERFAAVFFPHQCRVWFSKSRAALALLVIVLMLFIFDVHFFWTHHLKVHLLRYIDFNTMSLKTHKTPVCSVDMRIMQHYHFMTNVWPWMDMALFSLLPILIIGLGNVSICVKLIHSHLQRIKNTQGTSGNNSSFNKLRTTSITLAMVSCLFILSTLPVTIWQLFILRMPHTQDNWNRVQVTRSVIGLSQYVNNALNFFMYCVCGRQFRQEFIAMFRKTNKIHPQITGVQKNGTSRMTAKTTTTTRLTVPGTSKE